MSVADRLKYARESLGLTMKEVESRAGVGQSSLSAFENDMREPSFSQLTKLAEAYHRPDTFFFEKGEVVSQPVLWRRKPDAGAAESEALFLDLCRQYRQLEEWSGDAPEVALPRFDPPKPGGIEVLACEASRLLKLGDRPSLTLLPILEGDWGVKVFHLPLDKGNAVSAVSQDFGHAILLNANDGPRERAFSLAHDLYHLLTWGRTDASPECERDADLFAIHLLLPRQPFLRAIGRALRQGPGKTAGWHDILEVCREFGVPPHAVVRGLVVYHGADTGDIRLPDEQPLDSPPTRPARFVALAERLHRRGELSLGKLAGMLGIGRYEAHTKYACEVEDREINLGGPTK